MNLTMNDEKGQAIAYLVSQQTKTGSSNKAPLMDKSDLIPE